MIPQKTDPMAKFIRTGEGILVFGFNLALLVVPIVSNALTPTQSAKWATIIDGIAVISRTGLKMVASAQAKPPAAAAAAALEVAASAAYSPAGTTAPAVASVPTAPAVASVPTAAPAPSGEMSDPALAHVAAALVPDISDLGQLVTDAQEFSDPPAATDSQPVARPYSMSAGGNGQPQFQLAGTNSSPDAPFLTRLGG